MQISLRARLGFGFVAAIATTALISTAIGLWVIDKSIDANADDRARLDLNSARLVYQGRLEQVRDHLRFVSVGRALADALAAGDLAAAKAEVERAREQGHLDFLDVTDSKGRIVLQAQGPAAPRGAAPVSPLVSLALSEDRAVVSTMVRSAAELAAESASLAERARVAVVPFPGGTERPSEETAALVIEAAVPVEDRLRRKVGALLAGVLVNHDTTIVDRIRETIYEGETIAGKPVGEASLCLGDVRVATNLGMNGGRAVGTHVDPAVRQRVLAEGRTRVDSARVLGEWHFTAYEPIRDISGRPIGILSLGIPEARFTDLRDQVLYTFLGTSLAGLVLALGMAAFISGRLSRPLRQLSEAVQQVARGQLDRRVQVTDRIPEIAVVAESVNAMAAAVKERELQLRYRTQEQLGKAERLAMIGRLAAGVAHEINNPLGGVMLFANLMLKKAPPGTPERESLERICSETKRCQRIVQGLLDFARRRDPKFEDHDVHAVIDATMKLVGDQAMLHGVEVVKRFDRSCPPVRLDPSQIQQVLLNLVINAVDAMKGRGRLTIGTHLADHGGAVQIDVADTGCGISPENLERLFEPFFTTKEAGHGTGLGLSISRGIVENHGGTIWADSELAKGTTFSVRLPVAKAAA